jgi:hypothetical protein
MITLVVGLTCLTLLISKVTVGCVCVYVHSCMLTYVCMMYAHARTHTHVHTYTKSTSYLVVIFFCICKRESFVVSFYVVSACLLFLFLCIFSKNE